MKTPAPDSDARYENLLSRARADVGPSADLPALLRTVREARVAPVPAGWVAEFSTLFASGRIISACLTGAAAFALLATWQAWDSWQTLPWVQLFDTAMGGSS